MTIHIYSARGSTPQAASPKQNKQHNIRVGAQIQDLTLLNAQY